MRSLLPVLLGVSMAAACTVGDLGDDGTTGDDSSTGDDTGDDAGDDTVTPTPRVAVAMTPPTIDSELGTIDNDFTITVTGSDGFSGPVALAFTGVPADWNAALDLASVDVALDGTATAILNIRVPPDAIAATANIAVTATSTAAPASLATPGVLTVANQYTIHIPAGTGDGDVDHGLPPNLSMRAGTVLRIQNDDTISHRLHGDGVFPHEDEGAPTANPGGTYEVPLGSGTGVFYCHDHGSSNTTLLTVVE